MRHIIISCESNHHRSNDLHSRQMFNNIIATLAECVLILACSKNSTLYIKSSIFALSHCQPALILLENINAHLLLLRHGCCVSGSTLLNMGSRGAPQNAQLINSPAISTSDKMVGTGAMQFTYSLSQYVQIPSFTTGTDGLSFAFWFKYYSTGAHRSTTEAFWFKSTTPSTRPL